MARILQMRRRGWLPCRSCGASTAYRNAAAGCRNEPLCEPCLLWFARDLLLNVRGALERMHNADKE